jgi:hypothetical protein
MFCFQLFLHRVFGYRGVILFPWIGKVYDRDIATKEEKCVALFYFEAISSCRFFIKVIMVLGYLCYLNLHTLFVMVSCCDLGVWKWAMPMIRFLLNTSKR